MLFGVFAQKSGHSRFSAQTKTKTTTTILLCLTVLTALYSSKIAGTFGAFVAANEQVGYRACVHLMLRLVDCLIDACDLYLAEISGSGSNSGPNSSPNGVHELSNPFGGVGEGGEPMAVDASNLLNDKGNIRIEAIDQDLLWPANDNGNEQAEYPSTKPMNWMAPPLNKPNETNSTSTTTTTTTIRPPKSSNSSSSKQQQQLQQPALPFLSPALEHHEVEVDDDDNLSTSSCWPKAIKWIKEQLIALRMNLMNGAKASLRDTLDRFSELNAYLSDVCPTLAVGDSEPKMNHLGYVVEAIEVLNEINEESKNKDNSAATNNIKAAPLLLDTVQTGPNREKTATDAIKENYSYLTQIITSYNLVFNAVDSDIMGGGENKSKEGALNGAHLDMNMDHKSKSKNNNNNKPAKTDNESKMSGIFV